MKKLLFLVAAVASTFTATAQTLEKVGQYYYHKDEARTLYKSKFFDNWSVGLNVGAQTPTLNHAFFKNAKPSFGVELRKDFSPLFGVSAQVQAYLNGGPIGNGMRDAFVGKPYNIGSFGKQAIDNVKYTLNGNLSLSNLFGGYLGRPRTFELEAKVGGGFLYTYAGAAKDNDAFFVDLGANFLFNLGESRAWTIKLSPSIGYFIDPTSRAMLDEGDLNLNRSAVELQAGLVYHFGTSYGRHHFAYAKKNNVDEAGLNATINDLRNQLNAKQGEIAPLQQQVRTLQQQVNELRNRKPEVVQVEKKTDKRSIESMVHYRVNSTVIDASQVPNVERVAVYLKKYPNAKAHIVGYASVEGPAQNNMRLSIGRANAVKDMLVKKYKIAASRITVEGPGTTQMFQLNEWNRVSITTINESK